MAIRLLTIVFILAVGICSVLFKGRDIALKSVPREQLWPLFSQFFMFCSKGCEGGEGEDFLQHRVGTKTSQANGHYDQFILMPERILSKLKQYSHPFIINFNF